MRRGWRVEGPMIHLDCTCGAKFVIMPSKHVGLKDDMSIDEVLGSMEIRQWPEFVRWSKEHQDCGGNLR